MDPIISLSIDKVRSHLIENKFIQPTAQSYNGSKGIQTYAPLGLILKNKIINSWRKYFITNDIFEIETPILTKKEILVNSGHVGKFADPVISNGIETLRADHVVEDYVSKNNLDINLDLNENELLEIIKKYKIIENSENAVIISKNLMFNFDDQYLRPELAQGIFTEFDGYYPSNNLPFGLAQTGKSFRNEISPQPFIRLIEFTQAEVEWFFDPFDNSHPNFDSIKNLKPPLYEHSENLTIDEYVSNNTIINQIMGYYVGVIYKFALSLGFDNDVIRFRKHKVNELAHYAKECWDLEIKLVNGNWLECVGCAHRGSHDLTVHNTCGQNFIQKYSSKNNKFKIDLNIPLLKEKKYSEIDILKKNFYVEHSKKLYSQEELNVIMYNYRINTDFSKYIHIDQFDLFDQFIIISETTEIINSNVIPYVIEPSVGIDRIIFAMANNLLKKRSGDLNRIVFKLPIELNLYDFALFVLSNNEELISYVKTKLNFLNDKFKIYYDWSSVSIGKKYVRSDNIGIMFAITVDFDTLNNDTITLRNINDGEQQRIHIDMINQSCH